MPWTLYILFCDKKTYYIGISSNLPQRLKSHSSRSNLATKEFSYIECVYVEQYFSRKHAETREKQLKRWSVAKKKALITGNFKLLKQLSKSHELLEGKV